VLIHNDGRLAVDDFLLSLERLRLRREVLLVDTSKLEGPD
jgi:hypothetical protein